MLNTSPTRSESPLIFSSAKTKMRRAPTTKNQSTRLVQANKLLATLSNEDDLVQTPDNELKLERLDEIDTDGSMDSNLSVRVDTNEELKIGSAPNSTFNKTP